MLSANAVPNTIAPVPAKMTRRFNTAGNAQGARHISIEITQGDTDDVNIAETLGVGRIELSATEAPGSPVDVTMEFDDQGRLHTGAVHVKTGQAMSMHVDVQGGLREEEVQEYRDFMEKVGFSRPFDVAEAMENLEQVDDDDDDIVDLKEIGAVDAIVDPQEADDDDEIPMIEPI